MRLEYYDEGTLKKELKKIIGRHLDLSQYAVFFFGSRVTGNGDDRSDIDVGIEGMRAVPSDKLWKIRDDIETLPTLYKLDIVDFSNTSDSFRRVAKNKIEYINEPKNSPI